MIAALIILVQALAIVAAGTLFVMVALALALSVVLSASIVTDQLRSIATRLLAGRGV